jgi:hypothetical protein
LANQLPVKSRASFPYTYIGSDGSTKRSPGLAIEGMGFSQYVDLSGNTWVTIAGTAAMGGTTPGGLVVPVAVDALGNSTVAPPSIARGNSPLNSVSTAYEASRLVKQTAGVLFGLSGYNSKASTQFILLFDYAGPNVPPDTAVPVGPLITVAASSTFSVDFGFWGMTFNNGIWASNSSTGPTKTIGSADTWFAARYV